MVKFLAVAGIVIFVLFKVFGLNKKVDNAINHYPLKQKNRQEMLLHKIDNNESFTCKAMGKEQEDFKQKEDFTIFVNNAKDIYIESISSGRRYSVLFCH